MILTYWKGCILVTAFVKKVLLAANVTVVLWDINSIQSVHVVLVILLELMEKP
ncbi:hypothetical protein X975_12649, partial [Stegodyphus mimosarum]